jgi:SAM-dependent methyltransferase
VIYQDPLAYLLGLEGIALLDALAGDHEREFVDTRLAEIRRLLDDEKLRDRGVLAHARQRVPAGEFHVAELDRLPLPDDCADVIVCALALVHVPRLHPVLAEFARVLRPGGDLVISDLHHERVTRGSVIKARGPAGEPCIVATYRHHLGDCLPSAARAAGGCPSLVIWHFKLPAA